MAVVQEVVKKLTIVSSERGVDETANKLRGLAGAQSAVTVESQKSERATLNMEKRVDSIIGRYDKQFASLKRIETEQRALNLARAQGSLTAERHNEILGLQAASLDKTAVAANRLAVGMRFLSGFVTGFALGGLMQLPRLISDTISEAAGLVDVADKIGIATDELQKLHFAGRQSGVEITEMNAALSFFSRQVGEASRGAGDLSKILAANGVAIRDQRGQMRPLTDLMADYADLVANAGSSAEKATLVTKAFGKANDDLINTLAGGRAGLEGFAQEADDLNIIVGDRLLRNAAELDDRFAKLSDRIRTTFVVAVLELASAFDVLIDKITFAVQLLQAFGSGPVGVGVFLGEKILGVDQLREKMEGAARATEVLRGQLDQPIKSGTVGTLVTGVDFGGRFNPAAAGEAAKPTLLPELDKATAKAKEFKRELGDAFDIRPGVARATKELDGLNDRLFDARGLAQDFATGLPEGLKAGASLVGALIKRPALPVANDNTKGSSDERARRVAAA